MAPAPVFTLVLPDRDHLADYLDFCRETLGQVHYSYILHGTYAFDSWKDTLLRDYRNAERGIALPPGFVRSVTYWFFRDGRMIGIANHRPELNDLLHEYGGHLGIAIRPGERGKGYGKRLTLLMAQKARELGIGELLLTGQTGNAASSRLAESLPGSRHEYAEGTVDRKSVV